MHKRKKTIAPVRTAYVCVCLWLCIIVVHNTPRRHWTVLIIFPLILQTITTAQMMSVGGEWIIGWGRECPRIILTPVIVFLLLCPRVLLPGNFLATPPEMQYLVLVRYSNFWSTCTCTCTCTMLYLLHLCTVCILSERQYGSLLMPVQFVLQLFGAVQNTHDCLYPAFWSMICWMCGFMSKERNEIQSSENYWDWNQSACYQ